MGFADFFQSDHESYHQGNLTHDALGGAVSYEIAKAYEDHLAKNGKPDSHAKAKEIVAGLAGAALTRVLETKGADYWDEHQQRKAAENAQERFSEVIVNEY